MADDSAAATTTAPAAASPEGTTAPATAPAPFDWSKAGLAPEHLNLVTERGWKSPGDVMQSYRHLETATGVPPERLIKLPAPKDAANPEAWNKIYAQLGRPESAEKYVIPVPEGDKGEFASAVKPWLHEAGLSQSQATVLATKWNAFQAQTQQAQQTAIEQRNLTDVTQLKQEWGGEYDAKAAIVDRAAETFGMSQPQLDALKQVMGPKAAMQFLYNLGSKVGVEDSTVPGLAGQTGFGMTPEVAAARLKELRGDRNFAALMNSKDPKQRMEAHAEVRRLAQLSAPGHTPVSSGGRPMGA